MNKKTATKIISILIIFVFITSIFQNVLKVEAASEQGISNFYNNPNQGDNKYRFKLSDVVNSNMLTSVVGCTGVVNKVSTWMVKFIQSPGQAIKMANEKKKQVREQLAKACNATKASTQAGIGSIPLANDLVTAVSTIFNTITMNGSKPCADTVNDVSDEQIDEAIKQSEKMAETSTKEQCLDGIAVTLAKNQLTSMTRSAMNWVNSGYGGNPFFVQNMRNLTNNIEKNVIETGIDVLLSPNNVSPYARDFARTKISNYGIMSSSSKFLGGLQSSLSNFISDPSSYYSNDSLDKAYTTENVLERARRANNIFANDFSAGGWEGYWALTLMDKNNPLGFTMLANQYISDTQTQQVSEKRDELAQNSGFLSQTTCTEFMSKKDIQADLDIYNNSLPEGTDKESYDDYVARTYPKGIPCLKEKTITPGSIIKEKTTNYLNSPERQLELAKTINDSLNALFSILMSKLETGGLSGLSTNKVTTNWTDTINNFTSTDGNTSYDNNGAYSGFNITKDLGNTYLHLSEKPEEIGTWNANKNVATTKTYSTKLKPGEVLRLYPDSGPEIFNANGEAVDPTNKYYTVTTAGKTRLMIEGYNGWEVGDRVFWNGNTWQNWKKGQLNPIKNRGVIQIQQDYIIAAKEIVGLLPNVMEKLGELDYCLPGPNPSYQTNSTEAQAAYQGWIGSMYVGPRDENRVEWRIDHEDSRTYKILANIFADSPNTWTSVLGSSLMALLNDFDRNWVEGRTLSGEAISWLTGGSSIRCALDGQGGSPGNCQNYHWHRDGKSLSSDEQADVDNRKALMDKTLDYVNNQLFQNFYKVFGQQMDKVYFKNMTSMYNNTETSIDTTLNPAYVDMAQSGFDLTKNISYYNDDTIKVTKGYNDAISQAQINIAKLEPIKKKVSEIIKAAQDRQVANIVANIKKMKGNNTEPTAEEIAKFRAENKECLDEENIQVFDVDQLMKLNNSGDENCFNGIDDDLNGLVDSKDPACQAAIINNRRIVRPNYGIDSSYNSEDIYNSNGTYGSNGVYGSNGSY